MGAILIRCPITGQDVPTGIYMDEETFATLLPFTGQLMCPHCGKMHEWSKNQSWIEEGEAPDNRSE